MKAVYKQTWDDEYTAEGWKLEEGIGDPEIIAVTPWHPANIPTSVFVHDVLDHRISGFKLSGHRHEAGALFQLGIRTGVSVEPDISEMIELDILHGRVHGESLHEFLPPELDYFGEITDPLLRMTKIRQHLGDNHVRHFLKCFYYEIGKNYQEYVEKNWETAGLDYRKKTEIGGRLQELFERLHSLVRSNGIKHAMADITIDNESCNATLWSGQKQWRLES